MTVNSISAPTSGYFTANIYSAGTGFAAADDVTMRITIFSLIDYSQVFYSDPVYVTLTATIVNSG